MAVVKKAILVYSLVEAAPETERLLLAGEVLVEVDLVEGVTAAVAAQPVDSREVVAVDNAVVVAVLENNPQSSVA